MPSDISLRVACVVSFFIAIPLCIAHGASSSHSYLAFGLIPLAFSAGINFFILAKIRAGQRRQGQAASALFNDGDERPAYTNPLQDRLPQQGGLVADEYDWLIRHRILVFAIDVVCFPPLLAILILEWLKPAYQYRDSYGYHGDPGSVYMLAGYATLPLLFNLFVHYGLATKEFLIGSGLVHGLWLLFRNIIPEQTCPQCGGHVNPHSGSNSNSNNAPVSPRWIVPWYDAVAGKRVAFRSKGFEVPADRPKGFVRVTGGGEPTLSTSSRGASPVAVRQTTPPVWASHGQGRRGRPEDAELFVDDQNARGPPHDRYKDLPDDASVSMILEDEGRYSGNGNGQE